MNPAGLFNDFPGSINMVANASGEGFDKKAGRPILLMGATNVPWQLDPAVLDEVLEGAWKAADEQGIKGKLREIVVGVLIVGLGMLAALGLGNPQITAAHEERHVGQ